ncbi:MAG: acyl carrier protein [Clostridia bacterium]|nr:acyl carrier protein [Clostridia bacterium]
MFEKVREMISECFDIDQDEITLSTSFQSDLGFDELDMVDLVMDVEDIFEIELPDEDLEDIKTVGDLVKFIEENN